MDNESLKSSTGDLKLVNKSPRPFFTLFSVKWGVGGVSIDPIRGPFWFWCDLFGVTSSRILLLMDGRGHSCETQEKM